MGSEMFAAATCLKFKLKLSGPVDLSGPAVSEGSEVFGSTILLERTGQSLGSKGPGPGRRAFVGGEPQAPKMKQLAGARAQTRPGSRVLRQRPGSARPDEEALSGRSNNISGISARPVRRR